MSYVLAILIDDTFEVGEGRFLVLGSSIEQVLDSVADFLRAARPPVAAGGRLVVPTERPTEGWWEWMREQLQDVENLYLELFSTDREHEQWGISPMTYPAALKAWVEVTGPALARQHQPPVQTVETVPGYL